MKFRSGKMASTLDPRMVGFGFDTSFYEGGHCIFFQFGRRFWGVWWGQATAGGEV